MKKRALSLLLTITMLLSLVPAFGTMASATGEAEVSYRYPEFNTENTPDSGIKQWKDGSCEEYTTVTSSDTTWGATGQTTWYVVSSDTTIGNTVTVAGDVRLILKDGTTLMVTASSGGKAGINVTGGNSFTVYGQANDTGKLVAKGNLTGNNHGAGIGGNGGEGGSNITIYGGTVEATGNVYAAGIGGGKNGSGGNITIFGGKITATGGSSGGSGIGAGFNGGSANITIYGGMVTASSSGAAGIYGGTSGSITVATGLIVKAGNNANSTTVVSNDNPGTSNLKDSLDTAQYVKIAPAVCAVGSVSGTKYASIADALAADHNGENATTPTVIYLIGNDTENVSISAGRNITLDLNGKVLKADLGDSYPHSVITNNGTLTIKDSTMETTPATGTTRYFMDNKCAHGIVIGDECVNCVGNTAVKDSSFETLCTGDGAPTGTEGTDYVKVTGGCITGGTGTWGKAIHGGGIKNSGALTLTGGNIIGNRATFGGGIYNVGTFTMTGGTITGNKATLNGGGIYNAEGKSFTMSAGFVMENSAYNGGGVYNNGDGAQCFGVFNFEGGLISANIASNEDLGGGGIFNSGTLNMTGGIVSINTASGNNCNGGGIYNTHSMVMSNGAIANNSASSGGGIYNCGTLNMIGGSISDNTAEWLGGGICNSEDGPVGILTLGGKAKINKNTVSNAPSNLTIVAGSTINIGTGTDIPQNGMSVGMTLIGLEDPNAEIRVLVAKGGPFTTNGTETDLQYFTSDNDTYKVKFNADHLELVYVPTLYFGQNSTNSVEYFLYTDAARTKNYYTDFGSTWNVTWSDAENKPQLNLNGFNSNGSRVQIDCDCILNATGTNIITSENANGLVINQNTTITGTGTLNVSSTKDDAMAVNATATINGATVKCSATDFDKQDITFGTSGKIKLVSGDVQDKSGTSFYPDTLETLYLAKTSSKEYALYTDYETCNFEYAVGASGAEEVADSNHYAALILSGELNKKVVFKQDSTQTYSAVLRVTGTDTTLGSFDASEGTLTVQSANGNKVTVSGDIKAQKLYMAQCNGLTMDVVNGSIVAAEKDGVTNELMVGSNSDANKVKLTVKNGGIQFEKGVIAATNAEVTISKNEAGDAAGIGINAHRINLDGSKLTVSDVATGIKLYEPEQFGEGAVLSVGNHSTLNISATGVGVQGTYGVGGNYYNNITVLDTDSTITIAGGTKAVASAAITPIPSGKLVRSTDNKHVLFTINSDSAYTTDYYYADTTNAAKGLTLADITVFIDADITNGEVTVSDPGAAAGETVTVTATPNGGYVFDKITVNGNDSTDITAEVLSGSTITVPASNLPITVSASFTAASSGSSSTSTITVPISGDKDTVKVQATVSGTNATINNVTNEEIKQVGTGDTVVVNLSGLNKSVTGVTIPKTTFENVAASDAAGLEVKLPNGTVAVFDKTTLKAVASQAGSKDIKLVVDRDTKAEQSMTSAQKETLKELNKPIVLDAYFVSAGIRISDFKGGEAKLTAEYPTTNPVRVWYIVDNGEKELVPSTFNGTAASFTVTHFSHYVIEQLDGFSYNTCPQDVTCVYAKFSDANPKEWYHSGVHFCVEYGYMNGIGNDKFAPNGMLSRGMIVTMLWRMEGSPVVNYAMTFKDVAADQWYTEAIRWAQSTGVVLGYDKTSFGPNDNVTREQLAAILWRYAKLKGYDVSVGEDTNILSYDDAIGGVSSWAMSAIQWACGAGIINGIGNKLEARGFATRAQAACMMQRFCVNVAK